MTGLLFNVLCYLEIEFGGISSTYLVLIRHNINDLPAAR
jgi:hypothetical protein